MAKFFCFLVTVAMMMMTVVGCEHKHSQYVLLVPEIFEADEEAEDFQEPVQDLGILQVQENDAVRGNGDILLIEYGDYECPFCQMFHPTTERLVDEGIVTHVYRHFPLSFHLTAKEGALIAECVRTHKGADAFWAYTDGVFNAPSLGLETYRSLARAQGLTDAQIDACLAPDSVAQEMISQHMSGADELRVVGTPHSFLVNTKNHRVEEVPGALPYDAVMELIEKVRESAD